MGGGGLNLPTRLERGSPCSDTLHGRRLRHGELEHAVKFLQLRGGDVNGDFEGVPASQLAVFPGTTHFFGLARTDLVSNVVITFLDAPAPTGWADR